MKVAQTGSMAAVWAFSKLKLRASKSECLSDFFFVKLIHGSFIRYVCPRCDPNTRLNFANLKQLGSQGQELIKKTFKLIQVKLTNNSYRILLINHCRTIATVILSKSR